MTADEARKLTEEAQHPDYMDRVLVLIEAAAKYGERVVNPPVQYMTKTTIENLQTLGYSVVYRGISYDNYVWDVSW